MNDVLVRRPVDTERELLKIKRALQAFHATNDLEMLSPLLRHLVHLRAADQRSCLLHSHACEAREHGGSNARLDHLAGWPLMATCTPAEIAIPRH